MYKLHIYMMKENSMSEISFFSCHILCTLSKKCILEIKFKVSPKSPEKINLDTCRYLHSTYISICLSLNTPVIYISILFIYLSILVFDLSILIIYLPIYHLSIYFVWIYVSIYLLLYPPSSENHLLLRAEFKWCRNWNNNNNDVSTFQHLSFFSRF